MLILDSVFIILNCVCGLNVLSRGSVCSEQFRERERDNFDSSPYPKPMQSVYILMRYLTRFDSYSICHRILLILDIFNPYPFLPFCSPIFAFEDCEDSAFCLLCFFHFRRVYLNHQWITITIL